MAATFRGKNSSAYCWEADDNVPRRPAMTEFRRGQLLDADVLPAQTTAALRD